jgi:hypothetical protein
MFWNSKKGNSYTHIDEMNDLAEAYSRFADRQKTDHCISPGSLGHFMMKIVKELKSAYEQVQENTGAKLGDAQVTAEIKVFPLLTHDRTEQKEDGRKTEFYKMELMTTFPEAPSRLVWGTKDSKYSLGSQSPISLPSKSS